MGISSKHSKYSEDDDELKQSPSDSNEEMIKNGNNSNLVQYISKIPTPQPRPKDVEAEETMKRHLEALKPFEPSSHKAVTTKLNKTHNIINKKAEDDICYKSHSTTHLMLSSHSKNGRSKTPEPIKSESNKQLSVNVDDANKLNPNVIIYSHPNKNQKLEYLRGKSMRWKHPFGEASMS